MNLKEQLREKGITYNDILKVYGDPKMTKPLLTACFNGTVGFPKKLYRIILRMLGVSARDFIGDDAESDESGIITPDYELLNLLGIGKKNAVSRYDLTERLYPGRGHMKEYDRKMRGRIEQLRRDYVIVNDQDGGGYYITDDLDRIDKFYHQEFSRAMSILFRLKTPRKILRKAGML